MTLTRLDAQDAEQCLAACQGDVKTAIVAARRGVAPATAADLLAAAGGRLRSALEMPWPTRPWAACSTRTRERTTQQKVATDHESVSGRPFAPGVDGGGNKTTAWRPVKMLTANSRSWASALMGPSNPNSIGFDAMCRCLDQAVATAFADASLQRQSVASACLALSGVGRAGERQRVLDWCG